MEERRPVRFGILGCADIARKMSRAIALPPNASLATDGSRRIEKADSLPPFVKLYGCYEYVFDDASVGTVYVLLPRNIIIRWAVPAAEKKKSMLLEKPAALQMAELDQILETCKVNGVQLMDATMWLHHPRPRS